MNYTKSLYLFFLISLISSSCIFTEKRTDPDKEQKKSLAPDNYVEELSKEQEDSFNAWNTLQTNTDQRNRLYSTFAGIEHSCYPADTSFQISQSELLSYLEKFLAKHCHRLTKEYKHQLVTQAVLAQKNYMVLHCIEDSPLTNSTVEISMSGTWVLPNVLERRDVILVW